jgi:hypothetical protein
MTRNQWVFVVAAPIAFGSMGRALFFPGGAHGADRRLVNPDFVQTEKKLGYHLYAPTWLPSGGHIGQHGPTQGENRILQDYWSKDDRSLIILSQERRRAERDHYHEKLFKKRMEAKADINGKAGYFVTGSSGERRLFWNEPEMALIISSSILSDQELVDIARKIR